MLHVVRNLRLLYPYVHDALMPDRKYRNLSMPSEFIREMEKFIEDHKELGFSSLSELAKTAIRDYMRNKKKG